MPATAPTIFYTRPCLITQYEQHSKDDEVDFTILPFHHKWIDGCTKWNKKFVYGYLIRAALCGGSGEGLLVMPHNIYRINYAWMGLSFDIPMLINGRFRVPPLDIDTQILSTHTYTTRCTLLDRVDADTLHMSHHEMLALELELQNYNLSFYAPRQALPAQAAVWTARILKTKTPSYTPAIRDLLNLTPGIKTSHAMYDDLYTYMRILPALRKSKYNLEECAKLINTVPSKRTSNSNSVLLSVTKHVSIERIHTLLAEYPTLQRKHWKALAAASHVNLNQKA